MKQETEGKTKIARPLSNFDWETDIPTGDEDLSTYKE